MQNAFTHLSENQGDNLSYTLGQEVHCPIGLAVICDYDPSTEEYYVIPTNPEDPTQFINGCKVYFAADFVPKHQHP